MENFILNNLSFFIFVLFLTIFLYIKRKNLEFQGPVPFLYMILYKTKFGLKKMDSWANKHKKLFLYLSYLSIFIGIIGIFLSIIMMIWGISFTLENNLSSGGGLVLPLKTESGLDGAVPVFYVPFVYWIIALFILVVVHEFAHGVIAERFKIKIKSSGFAFGALFVPILPAAFVEPDEKSLKKANWWKQIAVLGAGSTSNFLFGFLFLFIWIFLAVPFVNNTQEIGHIHFNSVLNESSLKDYNITSGDILALNDNYNKSYIIQEFSNLTVGEKINLTINTSNGVGVYEIETFENPNRKEKGMIGISGLDFNLEPKKEYSYLGQSPIYFEKMFYYLWMLNIGIGIMNLLPIWITDGGQIARVLLTRYIRKEKLALSLYNYLSFLSLILIIFTIWPSTLIAILKLFGLN